APEQARGKPLDRRADVWAAGVVAWELIAARAMQSSEQDEAMTLLRLVSEDPPRVRSIASDVPEALDAAIASALVRDPANRCPTAAELRRRIVAACADSIAEPTAVSELVRRLLAPLLEERQRSFGATSSESTEPPETPPIAARGGLTVKTSPDEARAQDRS